MHFSFIKAFSFDLPCHIQYSYAIQSIVAAIREFGGGFLELDERSGVYYEIGDKKAWAKTSQALREGQTKIRQRIYREEEGQLMKNGENQAIPREGYLRYSIQVLESLYKSEETTLSHKPLQPEADNDNLVPSLPSLSDTQVASQEETNLELLANICAV